MYLLIFIVVIVIVSVTFMLIRLIPSTTSYEATYERDTDADLEMDETSKPFFIKQLKKTMEYDTHGAVKMIKKYLNKEPQDDNMRFMLAKLLYEQHKYADAIRHLDYVSKNAPNRIDLTNLLGKIYVDYGVKQRGIENYKKTLKIDENNVEALTALGALYLDTSQPRLAIKSYTQLLKLLKNEEDLLSVLRTIADIHLSLNEYNSALECYNKILVFQPNEVSILRNLKETYVKANLTEDAIILLKKLIIMDNKDYDLYEELMILLYKHKYYSEVLELAKQVTRYENADIANIQNIIAKVYMNTEQVEDSIVMLIEILEQYPENTYLHQTLAQAYMKMNRYDDAISVYIDLMEKDDITKMSMYKNNLSTIYCNYGTYLYKMDRHKEAFERFATALKYDASNSEVYYQIGYCNALIKNYNDAIPNIRKAIELEPNRYIYKLALADIYYGFGELVEAMKLYDIVLECEPHNVQALFMSGMISIKQLNPEKALDYFKTALIINPDNIEIRYNLALAYEYTQNKDAAIQEYESILEIDPSHEAAQNNLSLIKSVGDEA